MSRRPNHLAIFGMIAAAFWIGTLTLAVTTARATPPSGLSATALGGGDLGEPILASFHGDDIAPSSAREISTISVFKYALEPGGTFGWHQHSGPVWAVITAGTFTLYSGDDPLCRPEVFPAGSAFLDPGDRTHIGMNEGAIPVEIYAAFMLPPGGPPRIDVPAPGNCPF